MLWPDPAQRGRLVEIRDNLHARIAEAELEGLRVSAEDKLAQLDRRRSNHIVVDLAPPPRARQRSPKQTNEPVLIKHKERQFTRDRS